MFKTYIWWVYLRSNIELIRRDIFQIVIILNTLPLIRLHIPKKVKLLCRYPPSLMPFLIPNPHGNPASPWASPKRATLAKNQFTMVLWDHGFNLCVQNSLHKLNSLIFILRKRILIRHLNIESTQNSYLNEYPVTYFHHTRLFTYVPCPNLHCKRLPFLNHTTPEKNPMCPKLGYIRITICYAEYAIIRINAISVDVVYSTVLYGVFNES